MNLLTLAVMNLLTLAVLLLNTAVYFITDDPYTKTQSLVVMMGCVIIMRLEKDS